MISRHSDTPIYPPGSLFVTCPMALPGGGPMTACPRLPSNVVMRRSRPRRGIGAPREGKGMKM